MPKELQQLIEEWDGLAVLTRYDRATDAWIFVVLHDNSLGPATGGTRVQVYPRPADGLIDAMRLARGMTHKWAAIDLDFGGGKAVLALSRPLDADERNGLLERYGRLLRVLGGAFSTGQDLGTSTEDIARIARFAPHVHGFDPQTGQALDPGPYTARGVLAGIRAAVNHRFGSPELNRRSILILGVGGVGSPLARSCALAGAEVLVSDADTGKAERLAEVVDGQVIPPEDAHRRSCDVYSPCAVGATLNPTTIPELRCKIVAGSANNQLAQASDAELIHKRGILYAPDYVINSGGALAFGLKTRGEKSERVIADRLDGLQAVLEEIFTEAATRPESPLHAAQRRVERTLAAARERDQVSG